jgi:hypothetical protein
VELQRKKEKRYLLHLGSETGARYKQVNSMKHEREQQSESESKEQLPDSFDYDWPKWMVRLLAEHVVEDLAVFP